MPKASKRSSRKPEAQPQYYIFEIGKIRPNYILSVDHDRYREASYREFAGIDFETACLFPPKLAGRPISFSLMGERNFLVPEAFKRDSSWKPRCIGALQIKPDAGQFYMNVPHESLPFLTTLIVKGEARIAILFGESLSRGKALCSSFQLEKAVNLEDY